MKEKISLWQLFILIFLYNIGSTIVVNVGMGAGNDAWIAVIVACLLGLTLVLIYYYLLQSFSGKNLFQILEICLGKWLGRTVGYLYILYFFIIASLVLRDFGELMVSTFYSKTPIEFIHLTLILAILYILWLGLEVLARITEIFIPYALLFLLFLGFGVAFSGEVEVENLFPILGDGVKPLISPIFTELIHFPFGEFIAFMAIIPYVTNKKYARKVGIIAYLASGIILTYSTLLQITTIGVLKERTNFPLLSTARQISLLNFLERLDLLIIFIMMLGIIVKISILFYSGLKGLENISQIPYRSFVFPMAMLLAFFSMAIGEDYASYIETGIRIIPTYIQVFLQIIVPIFLLAITFFKKKQKSGDQT